MKAIVLTGGGTAGHVTPNLALIPLLQAYGYDVHYFGTRNGIEQQLLSDWPDVTYHAIRSGKLRRYFSWQNFVDPFRIIAGFFDSSKALKAISPDAVFSKGGFVSVPVVMAGRRRKLPVVLHESDYTPGLANRIAINYASKVCVTFEDTLQYTKGKGVFTGTPIRKELFAGDAEKGLSFLGFDGSKPVLLVMGGSQGAAAINEALRAALGDLLKTFDIAHLCGAGKIDETLTDTTGYRQYEYVGAELPDLFAAASIALSRAGANSVFEFLAIGLPALLIPLPKASSRGDQLQNAAYFERKGYSSVLFQQDMTPETLREALLTLHESHEIFREAMNSAENKDGTDAVLREIIHSIEQAPKKRRKPSRPPT